MESPTPSNGSESLTFQVTAERDCLIGICQCILWLATACRPPAQGSVHASNAAFKKVGVDRFVIQPEPLRLLPSPVSTTTIGCCWLNMFDGGYVLAQGFPVPPRKSGRGIELPFDIMVEQAMTYHTIAHKGSVILKGSHTALVPIFIDGVQTIDQAEEVQWHLIGKKPTLVHVDLPNESKRIEGYHLTDVEFATGDPELSWEVIDQRGLRMLPVRSIQDLSRKRSFVGHFPKAQILIGTKEAGYKQFERSGAKVVKGSVVKFGQAINITMGTNFGTAGIVNMTAGTALKRTKYDTTPKQVPALIGDHLRNRRNRPHILYDVEKQTAWMIPEACVILYLMHRWASFQEPPSVTDDQQEAPANHSSSRQTRRSIAEYMPFIEAPCDGGKKAADAIWSNFSQPLELPKYIRSAEDPEKPVYVANIVMKMYFTIDALVEHQKRKKPGFLTRQGSHPYMWGYELADVAELNEAPAKGIRINRARSGGWYNLTKPKSEIAILFGSKLGNLIKYEPDQMICHCWKSVPEGCDFLAAGSESLEYLQRGLDQRGLSNLFLSDKHSGNSIREPQQCANEAWPCCNIALQLEPTAPKVIIEVKKGEAVVIGKAVTRLKKAVQRDFEIPERMHANGPIESRRASGRLFDPSELPNGDPSGQASHEEAERDAAANSEESDSSDGAEYLSCDE
ncbi:hypothetical protein DL98DRAFT_523065 [Cadophora sp. DSE1049]|nr:hypothetical protein DL98DRAFT_523065 [Cadophora sp. DSE1049]